MCGRRDRVGGRSFRLRVLLRGRKNPAFLLVTRHLVHELRVDPWSLLREPVHQCGVAKQVGSAGARLGCGRRPRRTLRRRVGSIAHADAVANVGAGFVSVQRLQVVIHRVGGMFFASSGGAS